MAERFLASSSFPKMPEGKAVRMENPSGGLNLRELDYRLPPGESPEMKNLWWQDGLLCCRDGQEFVLADGLGAGICCFERLFDGKIIAHISDALYAITPGDTAVAEKLCEGLPQHRGTFIRYQDALLYKTRGAYKKITQDEEGLLKAEDVEAYVPVTVVNCTPAGSGDLYQPENRLSHKKTVWYTAGREAYTATFIAKQYTKVFTYEPKDGLPVASVEQVYLNTTLQEKGTYTLSEDLKTLTLAEYPEEGTAVTVVYTVGIREYHLPVDHVDSIDEVTVDDVAVTDYDADLQTGIITFAAAPAVQDPPVNNTVKITYTKENQEAYQAIMDCTYVTAYGGTGGAVLVLAGSTKQPNAYFWNGANVSMDMGYFPMDQYNLAGDDLEAVTGFGHQAGYLMIFKERSVGRCLLASATIEDRAYLTLDYTPVSVSLGCDLPWTIRTVENNLVWCSTYAGVCRLDDTNAALENRVRCISRKVLGTGGKGLLKAVRQAETVCALDDGSRYWVAADGEVYAWDYSISTFARPSWFYFTSIAAVAFVRADDLTLSEDDGFGYTGPRQIYHLDRQGRISRFVRTFRDYGGAIEKVYRFPAQDFGDLERLKHIKKVLLTTRSDTDTVLQLSYHTDCGERAEARPIRSYSHRLLPRNLAFRCLAVRAFAHVAMRMPMCRYVRYFSMRLYNNEPGCDMSLVSAEIYADLVIKER